MFRIKQLAEDADAQLVLVLAFLAALLLAFLPDPAWSRLVERGAYLASLGGGVLGVVAMRYLLRIAGTFQTGKVLAAAAADPNSPEVVTLVEYGTKAQLATLPAGDVLSDDDLDELDRAAGEAG